MKMRGGSTSILQLHIFCATELKGEVVQVLLVVKQVKKSDRLACGFLKDLFWATDRVDLAEEVRLKMGREIRKKKKVKQLDNALATVPKVEGTKEDSENSYSDTDKEEEEDATEAEFENTLPI
jgi:hypothetical protein